jgi:hypothetical protein
MSYYSQNIRPQNKEIVLKIQREKHQVLYKGKPTIIIACLSTDTLKTRSSWNYVSNPERK